MIPSRKGQSGAVAGAIAIVTAAVVAAGACGGTPASGPSVPPDAGEASVASMDAAVDATDAGARADTSLPAADATPPVPEGGEAGDDASIASRCTIAGTSIICDHSVGSLADGSGNRSVAYETPLGSPPAAGWPVVVYFQGSFVPGDTAFSAMQSDALGLYQLTLTIKALLDGGYAVIAPNAQSNGTTYWQTNVAPCAQSWAGCADDVMMGNLFASVAGGTFGALDSTRLYAMGISSGGFMTSRMAVSYAGKFRALADCSGSYATCGATCAVPTPLPSDHPPTLFLHGDQDTVVPMSAVQPYVDALTAEGHEVKVVTDPAAGHEWLTAGPSAIRSWFDLHP